MQPMHWFVYIFVAGSDNIINLKVNGQIPQKSNLSCSLFKILILTKYKAKLREKLVSLNNAITMYLITKPEQRSNLSDENNYCYRFW